MQHQDALQKINRKYRDKVREMYGHFLCGPHCNIDLAQKVYIIPQERCVNTLSDIANNRGKCVYNSGKIFLRENAFFQNGCYNEHLLVHEYIHRLSSNRKRNGLFPVWGSGFDFKYKYADYTILNELITEWVTFSITNCSERTPYQFELGLVEGIKKSLGNDKFLQLLNAYFCSDLQVLDTLLFSIYGTNLYFEIDNINKGFHNKYGL